MKTTVNGKAWEARSSWPGGSGLFASDSPEAALGWFRRGVQERMGSAPTADEEKYFLDGHEVARREASWRLVRRGEKRAAPSA